MNMTASNYQENVRAKVNQETAKIAWKELQRFFAASMAIQVSEELDLIEVAFQVSEDNATQIREWMEKGKFGKVSDEQAGAWFECDALLWVVVISPWVLVQPTRK